MEKDLLDYYEKMNLSLMREDYDFLLRDDIMKDKGEGIRILSSPESEDSLETVIPFYSLAIAAGEFLHSDTPPEPQGWVDVSGHSRHRVFDRSMFVSQIKGHSMEPMIPDGCYCLFTSNVGGTRNGKIVLAQKLDMQDVDTGASYTLKRYESKKVISAEGDWRHERIVLKAINPDYPDIELNPDEDIDVIAFWLEVLEP